MTSTEAGTLAESCWRDDVSREQLRRCLLIALFVHGGFVGLLAASQQQDRTEALVVDVEVEVTELERDEPTPMEQNVPARPTELVASQLFAKVTLDTVEAIAPDEDGNEEELTNVGPAAAFKAFDDPFDTDDVRPKAARRDWGADAVPLLPNTSLGDELRRADTRGGPGSGREQRQIRRRGLGAHYGAPEAEVPVISFDSVHGAGRRGALRGVLCHIDPGTRSLHDIARCRAEAIFYTDSPDTYTKMRWARFGRREWFAINYTGKFHVSLAGLYAFHLRSHDGSMLWIDGKVLIDNDGLHPPKNRTDSVQLAKGEHRLRLMHFQGKELVECGGPTIPPKPTRPPSKPVPVGEMPGNEPKPKPKKCRAGLLELLVTPPGKPVRPFVPTL